MPWNLEGEEMEIDLNDVGYVGETTITIRDSRRRLTIPKEVVEKLGMVNGDRIRWILFKDGRLYLSRVEDVQ